MNKTLMYSLIGVGGVIVVGVGAVLAMAMQKPDVMHVERSATISAPAADIHPFLNDFNKFSDWSPWAGLDPDQTTTISDPSAGVGATYEWKGNADVGAGKMTITASTPTRIDQDLEFMEPSPGTATTTMLLAEAGDGTKVTWSLDMNADLMTKVMLTVMNIDMEEQVGSEYEKGLASLKTVSESAAMARMEAEKKAAEEAARVAAEEAAMQAAEGEEGMAEGVSAGG